MLETSKDVLNLVLALCIAVFTGFVCTMLWYLIAVLRDAYGLVKEVKEKLAAVENAVKGIKEKLEHSASYLGVVASAVKMGMGWMEDRKGKVEKKVRKIKEELESEDEE